MKKNEVAIGKTYVVKVSGVLAPVKLMSESIYGGWNGENVKTGRAVRIKTAARLRKEVVAKQPSAGRSVPTQDSTVA